MTASSPETPAPDVQWYLARDGKQHGPLTHAEMAKLVELGHLRASDLVWRAGFADWRTATSVFPEMKSQQPRPAAPPPQPAPAPQPQQRQPEPTAPAARPQQAQAPYSPAPSPYAPPQEMLEPQTPFRQPSAQAPYPDARPYGYGVDPSAHARPAANPAVGRYGDPEYGGGPADYAPAKRRSRKGFVFGVLTTLALVVGGGYVMKDSILAALVGDQKKSAERKAPPKVAAPQGPTRTAAEPQAANAAASATGGTPSTVASIDPISRQLDGPVPRSSSEIDAELQSRRLWVAVKQDFPEWYSVRVNEASRLATDGKSRADIMRHLVEALVAMRRDNASHALAATTEKHRQLATAFLSNLKQLSQESSQACYDFISKGELSPSIVSRIQQPDQAAGIEAQLAVILSAITEGRKSPVTHAAPGKADYDVLATELSRIGWTQADMQLFADPKALAKASHEKVCKMLQDWFTAHLAVPDPKVQERLLFETLKPVISGLSEPTRCSRPLSKF